MEQSTIATNEAYLYEQESSSHEMNASIYFPKVKFQIKRRNYTVKTASTLKEYKQAFKLRFDVFYGEMQDLGNNIEGFDCDVFDQIGDLLIIKDDDTDQVVGTYRMIASAFSSQYYSQTEFDLSLFMDKHENVMEVSRACVHKDYRNGVTLSLLWQGIMEYAKQVNAQYLFGCSSIWTEDPKVAAQLLARFEKNGVHKSELGIKPLAKYNKQVSEITAEEGDTDGLISPLLKTYLRAGANLYGEPAYDKEFKCFDFFTVLNLESIQGKYRRKYC